MARSVFRETPPFGRIIRVQWGDFQAVAGSNFVSSFVVSIKRKGNVFASTQTTVGVEGRGLNSISYGNDGADGKVWAGGGLGLSGENPASLLGGLVFISRDGLSWSNSSISGDASLHEQGASPVFGYLKDENERFLTDARGGRIGRWVMASSRTIYSSNSPSGWGQTGSFANGPSVGGPLGEIAGVSYANGLFFVGETGHAHGIYKPDPGVPGIPVEAGKAILHVSRSGTGWSQINLSSNEWGSAVFNVAYGNGLYVLSGYEGEYLGNFIRAGVDTNEPIIRPRLVTYTSTNGFSWSGPNRVGSDVDFPQFSEGTISPQLVSFGKGKFIIVGMGEPDVTPDSFTTPFSWDRRIYASVNGTGWSQVAGGEGTFACSTYSVNGSTFLIGGSSGSSFAGQAGEIVASLDGLNWNTIYSGNVGNNIVNIGTKET